MVINGGCMCDNQRCYQSVFNVVGMVRGLETYSAEKSLVKMRHGYKSVKSYL